MNLKATVAQIIQEKQGGYVEGIRFTGSYEGEEFNVSITRHDEPDLFENGALVCTTRCGSWATTSASSWNIPKRQLLCEAHAYAPIPLLPLRIPYYALCSDVRSI